jgi:hypothetical protein
MTMKQALSLLKLSKAKICIKKLLQQVLEWEKHRNYRTIYNQTKETRVILKEMEVKRDVYQWVELAPETVTVFSENYHTAAE